MSGQGIGIPSVIIPGIITPAKQSNYPVVAGSCMSLARYASIIGYSESAFFGISDETNDKSACRNIWSKYQRDTIYDYLQEAIAELENVIGYPLCPRWIVAEQHKYANPLLLDYGKILDIGVQVSTTIASGALINYLTDPTTVTIPTAITSSNDIHVFYPGTDVEITPSGIALSGGNLVISIPKSRLVDYDKLDNPDQGWIGSDATVYQSDVDVAQYSTSTLSQASFIYDPSVCASDCLTTSLDACVWIDNAEVGIIRLGRADGYTCLCNPIPRNVTVNYRAGLVTLTRTIESAIVRLAHSRMPTEPCGCDVTQRLWKRDRNVPVVLDRERLNCPFGISDGAWSAWRMAISIANFRMTEFSKGL